MWRFVDLAANYFVPPEIREDPEKRRSAMRYRATARMLIIIVLVFFLGNAIILFATYPDYLTEISLLYLGLFCNALALLLIRLFRTFLTPLLIANLGTAGSFLAATSTSGGLSSPFVFLFLTIPALSISFGDRRIFLSAWLSITAIFVGVFLAHKFRLIAPHVPLDAHANFQFIMLIAGITLMGLGGVAAQLSIDQSRRAVRMANAQLAEKNEMLEGLSGKLAKYLSPQVYSSIFEGKQDVKVGAVRKKLTVYFADIVDFTATTEAMEAEDISNLMNEYFDQMAEIILRHGGTIDKYMGDAIMVFFGDPETKGEKEDAIACVRMALEMEAHLLHLQSKWLAQGVTRPLAMRAGINTGYCTVGNFGSENRMDYTIIGGQVNVAARLEAAAEPGTILISHQTHALVKDVFDCESIGQIQVKGIAEPIGAYKVASKGDTGEVREIIRENLEGLSLFVDPNSISKNDRANAIDYLRKAIKKLEG